MSTCFLKILTCCWWLLQECINRINSLESMGVYPSVSHHQFSSSYISAWMKINFIFIAFLLLPWRYLAHVTYTQTVFCSNKSDVGLNYSGRTFLIWWVSFFYYRPSFRGDGWSREIHIHLPWRNEGCCRLHQAWRQGQHLTPCKQVEPVHRSRAESPVCWGNRRHGRNHCQLRISSLHVRSCSTRSPLFHVPCRSRKTFKFKTEEQGKFIGALIQWEVIGF